MEFWKIITNTVHQTLQKIHLKRDKGNSSSKAPTDRRKLLGQELHDCFYFIGKSGQEEVQEKTFFEQTTVTFYPLSEEELKALSESDEPLDKAGAYAIQGEAGVYISRINGDVMNVIGLPVPRLLQEIKKMKG